MVCTRISKLCGGYPQTELAVLSAHGANQLGTPSLDHPLAFIVGGS